MRRLLGLLLAGLLAAAGGTSPASAATGYTMVTTAAYVVDPSSGLVAVTVQVVFSNATPDSATRVSAFDRIDLAVQRGASEASAKDAKGALAVHLAARDGVTVASVTPRARVRFGQQARFNLSFVLADLAAPDLHVRPEVAEFTAWGFGTASEVTIDLAPNLEVHADGAKLATDAGAERTRLSSGPIADPAHWLVRVTAIGQTTLTTVTRRVTLASATVDLQVRAWSGDVAWGDRVVALISQTLPLLEAEAGLPYPRVGPLAVVESVPLSDLTDEGAASTAEIRISFSASDFTVIHQLAHVWAGPQLAAARWLREGLASHLAERATRALSIDPPYLPATRASELAADAFPLERWGAVPSGAAADAYAYAASWALIDRVTLAIGEAKLRLALARAAAGLSAYDPTQPSGSGTGGTAAPIDSRRLLDQLAEVSGTDLGDLFGAQVFAPEDAPELHQRAVARVAYGSMLAQAGDWGAPDAIRSAMAAWAFDDALRQISDARRWLAQRDLFLDALEGAGLGLPDRLRERYRTEGGGPGAQAELGAERAVVEAMVAARERTAAAGGMVEQIGLFGSNDSQRMLVDAGASFAGGDLRTASELIAAAERRLDGALVAGLERLAAVGLALLVLAGVLALRARRGPRSHYTAAP